MCARDSANQTSKTKNICLGEMSESYCALRITRQEPVVLNTDPASPPPLRCPECPSSAWRNYNAQVCHRCRRCRFRSDRGVRGKCRLDPNFGRLGVRARLLLLRRLRQALVLLTRTERPATEGAGRSLFSSWTHPSTWGKIMRKSAMAALGVISVLSSVAGSSSAHASRNWPERFRFAPPVQFAV